MSQTRPRHRRRVLLASAAVCAAFGLALSGCTTGEPESARTASANTAPDSGIIADSGLAGLDAAEVIERLDTMPVAERPSDLYASVQPDAVVLTDAQDRQVSLPLPEDKVYVSVAPYRNQTHDCYFHSLTTCLGELDNTDVQVTLTSSDGQVLVDETRRTYDNGFLGLWVPRDIEASLKISHAGRSATTEISTSREDDPTCITTIQLV